MYLKDNRVDTIVDLIKKYGGGTPQGGAPFQQLVTDADGKAVWEERLAYEGVSETVIIPRTTFVTEQLMGSSGYAVPNIDLYVFEAGKEYTIEWDGVVYNAVGMPVDGICALTFGEFGEESEPVMIAVIPPNPDMFAIITPSDWGTEHTLTVRAEEFLIKTIDPKYLPEHLQFGEAETETVIADKQFAESDFEYLEGENAWELPADLLFPDGLNITEGEKYIVEYDGVKYPCVVQPFDFEDIAISCIGNAKGFAAMGIPGAEDTGEPFMFIVRNNDNFDIGVYAFTGGDHSIKIAKVTEYIKTIDPKFLPGGGSGGGVFVVSFDQDENYDVIADKTFDEIIAALDNGQPVIGIQRKRIDGTLRAGGVLELATAYAGLNGMYELRFSTGLVTQGTMGLIQSFIMAKDNTVTMVGYTFDVTEIRI